jgi:hypothetical protein
MASSIASPPHRPGWPRAPQHRTEASVVLTLAVSPGLDADPEADKAFMIRPFRRTPCAPGWAGYGGAGERPRRARAGGPRRQVAGRDFRAIEGEGAAIRRRATPRSSHEREDAHATFEGACRRRPHLPPCWILHVDGTRRVRSNRPRGALRVGPPPSHRSSARGSKHRLPVTRGGGSHEPEWRWFRGRPSNDLSALRSFASRKGSS